MKSIRMRLLAMLIPATVVALLVTAFGIERVVSRDLGLALDRRVLLLARGVGAALDVEIDGTVEFELEEGEMPELARAAREAFYAVADEGGGVLFSSAPVPSGLLTGKGEGPSCLDVDLGDGNLRVCLLSVLREPEADEEDREEWLEENPGLPLPALGPQRFLIAAGMTDRGLKNSIVLLRRRLLAGFGLLSLLLTAAAVWAANRSLRPLQRLSHQADAVGPDDPGARLKEEGVDGEVRPLVTALNGALERLGQAYEQQKRFTADAAHELRSPLSAVRAQCEVGLRRDRSREELKEALSSVHRTTLRLGAVVENLLSLARLQNGSTAFEKAPLDLAATAREAMALLAPLAESRRTSVAVDLPDSIPVRGSEQLLAECLSNILENAIRYTPEGGRVTIEGGDGRRPWLSVADTGIGIPEEKIDRIFERFYRVDPSRSREEGSGLGLSIASTIARLHGAGISVESTPGKGSRFTLRFEDA